MSITLDTIMLSTLAKILDSRSWVEDSAALKNGIQDFCNRFDTIEQIIRMTKAYERALSPEVKATRKFLDIINPAIAVLGSAVSLLPLLSSSSIDDSQPAGKDNNQPSLASWGIACTGLTIAALAAIKCKYLHLPPREESCKSSLSRLWTKLDGKVPDDFLKAKETLDRQFRAHRTGYERLCRYVNMQQPESLRKILLFGDFFRRA